MSTHTRAIDAEPDVATGGDSTAESDDEEPVFGAHHVARRSIVIPDLKLLFLPMPKAACTSILWQLSELVGLTPERFNTSALPEVSTALAIHDMSKWSREFRWSALDAERRAEIQADDSWFRFTLVRNPAHRVWSAWQSKLLLREPRWLAEWGGEAWFPGVPSTPQALVEDFRAFVTALADGGIQDVHWAVQHDLTSELDLNHIGRTESIQATSAALEHHLAGLGVSAPIRPGRENPTPLPMPPDAFDAGAAEVLNTRFAADFDAFGYPRAKADGADNEQWAASTAPLLPILRELIDHNTRIGQLSHLARERERMRRQVVRRLRSTEERLERHTSKRSGGGFPSVMTNLEENSDFTVRWAWRDGRLDPGFTAVVRVKNEARPLPYVLPPLLKAVGRVVLVDNGSTDGTPEIAADVAARSGAADKLKVVHYPYDVARCGEDHLHTPAASIHSLTYFYNWSFSQVRTSYALKWDGDMVLTESGVKALQDLDWQLEGSLRIVTMPRYPLYVADFSTAFLDVGLANNEPWGWPNRPGYSHVKAIEWELPLWPKDSKTISLPEWSCIELKWLDADEFAHWSTNDFTLTGRTRRKEREWGVFQALNEGAEPPEGVIPITAPPGVDVVDYVRCEWMLAERDQLNALSQRLNRDRKRPTRA